jgi:quercetin dioxygenase-like cupin family protein
MPTFDNLENYFRGWLIGDFEPSIMRSKEFEVCIAYHQMGEYSPAHFHTKSEEINVVLSGQLTVNGRNLMAGDIFWYHKNEPSDVSFLADTSLLVVRVPSAPGDKVILQ